MCKKVVMLGVIALAVGLMVLPAKSDGPSGPSGKSNIGHVYLYEKVLAGTWEIIEGGAWGKMKYILSGDSFVFVFNGHGLEPEQEYTLIYYPDPWPGNGLICFGSDTADGSGNVHIKEAVDVDTGTNDNGDTNCLPADCDTNPGAKFWLVLSSDVDCDNGMMTGWNPDEYLFEAAMISFNSEVIEYLLQ